MTELLSFTVRDELFGDSNQQVADAATAITPQMRIFQLLMLPLKAVCCLHKCIYQRIFKTAYPSLVTENKNNGTMEECHLQVLYHG